tara:strand:+ start:1866 stop:2972 length:1107 start_codon:yes stop_codon:yes gene_type:complete
MLFKGTSKRPRPKDVSETIERVGGYINAGTERELTVYWSRVARTHMPVAMDLLTDMLQDSLFDPAEIEKERQVILEELHQVNDVPSQKAFLLNDSLLWPNQPLGRDIGGTPETVNSITKDMMIDYMTDQYRPNNVVLVVAGQIEHAEVEDLLSKSSLDLRSVGNREMIPAKETKLDNPIIVEHRSTEQAHICLSFPGISVMDSDRYSLDLLNTVLGEGMASRLFLSLREDKGLVYEVGSSVAKLTDTGSMTIYAGTDPSNANDAIQGIIEELDRAIEHIDQSELDRARELIKGRLFLGLEDTRSVSSWLGGQELLLNRLRSPDEVASELDQLKLDDIKRVAERLFKPELYRIAIVGPYESDKQFRRLI